MSSRLTSDFLSTEVLQFDKLRLSVVLDVIVAVEVVVVVVKTLVACCSARDGRRNAFPKQQRGKRTLSSHVTDLKREITARLAKDIDRKPKDFSTGMVEAHTPFKH